MVPRSIQIHGVGTASVYGRTTFPPSPQADLARRPNSVMDAETGAPAVPTLGALLEVRTNRVAATRFTRRALAAVVAETPAAAASALIPLTTVTTDGSFAHGAVNTRAPVLTRGIRTDDALRALLVVLTPTAFAGKSPAAPAFVAPPPVCTQIATVMRCTAEGAVLARVAVPAWTHEASPAGFPVLADAASVAYHTFILSSMVLTSLVC